LEFLCPVIFLTIFIAAGCYRIDEQEHDSDSESLDSESVDAEDTTSDSGYPEQCAERDSEQCELDTECRNLMGYYIMEHDGMVYSCRESYRQIECVNNSRCDTDEILIRSETRGCWVGVNYCEGETEGWTSDDLEEICEFSEESIFDCE